MAYQVKEVAELVGVTVRTLHHYDQIGLLRPATVSAAGYRLYGDADLDRLQQVLFLKELDFSLQEIKRILDSPGFDRKRALVTHKKLLLEKRARLDRILSTLEVTLQSIEGGREMDRKDMFDAFDMTEIEKHKEKYAEEVRQKYPKEIVAESERKTSGYNKNDWARLQARGQEIFASMAEHMDRQPSDPEIQELVEQYFRYINDNFYTCTVEIFRGLGELYITDERFTAYYEKIRPGLAQFVSKAFHAYCDNRDE